MASHAWVEIEGCSSEGEGGEDKGESRKKRGTHRALLPLNLS